MDRHQGSDWARHGSWLEYIAAALALIVSCGCSKQPTRVAPPTIDATAAAAAALAEYDTNHDGVISGKELDRVPALKSALDRYGKGTGKVTAEAIAERIHLWQDSKVALTNLGVTVTLDGRPLDGATVTAEPEAFLGSAVLPASGVTDHTGSAPLRIKDKSGISYGLYKIRVSKMAGGREVIPPRYNTETELGVEVAPKANTTGGITLNLLSQ
jgi:hypothetical protein